MQVLCWADGEVLFERYKARLKSDRHLGHAEVGGLDIGWKELSAGKAQPMPIGGQTIEVDTTDFDAVDYQSLYEALSA